MPVVFMSGYEERDAPIADGFVHKPFTMDDLRDVLADVAARPTSAAHPR